MYPSHAGVLGVHARPIMLMQAPPNVPNNITLGTDAEPQPATVKEVKEVHEPDPLVEEVMMMQDPQTQLKEVQEIAELKEMHEHDPFAEESQELPEIVDGIERMLSEIVALKQAGAAKDVKLGEQSDQIQQMTSERATEKIQTAARDQHIRTLELDNAKWERVARSYGGFSIGLCQPSGNCVLSDCLLPSDTVKTLFERACSAFDAPKQALHIVVGEDAFSWLDDDPARLLMTLESLQLQNGASVTCVFNSNFSANPRAFEVGEKVEYWSRTHRQWMRGEVSHIPGYLDDKGLPLLYDLDVKGGASVLHMRAMPSNGGA